MSSQGSSNIAQRIYQREEVEAIGKQADSLAAVLTRASKLLNNACEMDARSRKLLRQIWEESEELFASLAELLHHGDVGAFPLTVSAMDDTGSPVSENNKTLVSEILRDLWRQIEWLRHEERSPSMLFSLERVSQDLLKQTRRLHAAIGHGSKVAAV